MGKGQGFISLGPGAAICCRFMSKSFPSVDFKKSLLFAGREKGRSFLADVAVPRRRQGRASNFVGDGVFPWGYLWVAAQSRAEPDVLRGIMRISGESCSF